MKEELAVLAIANELPLTAAIGQVCRANTTSHARDLLLAAISVATQIDANSAGLSNSDPGRLLGQYKAVVALTADVIALRASTQTCADLIALWDKTGDTLFAS